MAGKKTQSYNDNPPTTWLTDEVNIFKEALNDARYSALTPQVKCQMKTRGRIGEKSTSDKPNVMQWMDYLY